MATGRGSLRARPLDVQKAMEIVRDESLLDSAEAFPIRDIAHNQAEVDDGNEKKISSHGKVAKEIPTPITLTVNTYVLDYLPTFNEGNTYIRGKGGLGYDDPTFVEYDLDSEDFQWLSQINTDGQERLSAEKMEMMLWKLDLANAEATDKVFSFQGTAAAERKSVQACATTDHLQKQDALQMLQETCPSRDRIREAVYTYWKEKRGKLGRPLVGRLQAPTPLNASDPYKVFRSRDRPNRPQTRRRRENNADSLEKLNMVGENIKMAIQLFELVLQRERKKRDKVYVAIDEQQLQMRTKHHMKGSSGETIEEEYMQAGKGKGIKRPIGFEHLPDATPGSTNKLLDFKNKLGKKKRRLGEDPILNAVSQLMPAPKSPEEKLLCTWIKSEDLEKIFGHEFEGCGNFRIGRQGRLIIDRCNPFTMRAETEDELENDSIDKALQDAGQLNPFPQWSEKVELANKALSKVLVRATPVEESNKMRN